MRKAFFRMLFFILILAIGLPIGYAESGDEKTTITFVNKSGASISEIYIAPESKAYFGAAKNNRWLKTEESIDLLFSADELSTTTEWKVNIGILRSGRISYINLNKVDFSLFTETGIANFIYNTETKSYELRTGKKDFFTMSNTTSYNIVSLFLFPSGSENGSNRLMKPFLPGETLQIRMDYEEIIEDTSWNLRIGVEEELGVTYFTLKDFPIEKLTGCECVILKPYKDSISFSYSKIPLAD